MSNDPKKTHETEVPLETLRLGSTMAPPTKADLQTMFKTCREQGGREIEWVWTEEAKGRHLRLSTRYPLIKTREYWDWELRDDPTWTLSDDRDHGNPIIWHYKTSDLDLVFEITRMAEKKTAHPTKSGSTASGTEYEAVPTEAINHINVTDDFASEMLSPETGILSYSAFLIFLQREFHWFEAYGAPLSLVVFDVKAQTPGSDNTARWLSPETAKLLDRRVIRRQCDTFGHFESVDYGLILPSTDPRQAMAIAQRVMQILTKLPLIKEQPNTRLVLTCGVANLPANGTDLASLVFAAKGAKSTALKTGQSILLADASKRYTDETQERTKKTTSEIAVSVMGLRELLVRSGLVNEEYLDTAMNLAKRMPLGRVLAMEGHCKESAVDAAIELANMIRAMQVTPDEGLRTLRLVGNYDLDLDTALTRIGVVKGGLKPNQFGDLLKDAGLVSTKQLALGRREAAFTGLPLGTTLAYQNSIGDAMLKAALNCQRLIRDDKLARSDAIAALDRMRVGGTTLQQALENLNINLPKDGIGETLIRQGKLTETELMVAYEIQLNSSRSLEGALLQCGFVSEEQITAAQESLAKEHA